MTAEEIRSGREMRSKARGICFKAQGVFHCIREKGETCEHDTDKITNKEGGES